jgi:hypothetical protein
MHLTLIEVLKSCCFCCPPGVNASRLTYDGLDVLGDRLAALITSFITRLHTTPIEPSYHVPTTGPFLPPNRRVAKISFIGYR